jgi:hypothetical protein
VRLLKALSKKARTSLEKDKATWLEDSQQLWEEWKGYLPQPSFLDKMAQKVGQSVEGIWRKSSPQQGKKGRNQYKRKPTEKA